MVIQSCLLKHFARIQNRCAALILPNEILQFYMWKSPFWNRCDKFARCRGAKLLIQSLKDEQNKKRITNTTQTHWFTFNEDFSYTSKNQKNVETKWTTSQRHQAIFKFISNSLPQANNLFIIFFVCLAFAQSFSSLHPNRLQIYQFLSLECICTQLVSYLLLLIFSFNSNAISMFANLSFEESHWAFRKTACVCVCVRACAMGMHLNSGKFHSRVCFSQVSGTHLKMCTNNNIQMYLSFVAAFCNSQYSVLTKFSCFRNFWMKHLKCTIF